MNVSTCVRECLFVFFIALRLHLVLCDYYIIIYSPSVSYFALFVCREMLLKCKISSIKIQIVQYLKQNTMSQPCRWRINIFLVVYFPLFHTFAMRMYLEMISICVFFHRLSYLFVFAVFFFFVCLFFCSFSKLWITRQWVKNVTAHSI